MRIDPEVGAASTAIRRPAKQLLEPMARVGWAARGVVFAVLGALVLSTGAGLKASENDPVGALEEIARHPMGKALVGCVGFGLAVYAAWCVAHGALLTWGSRRERKSLVIGIGYVLTGVFYAPLAWAGLELMLGRHDEPRERHFGALFAQPYGRALVAALGIVILVVALVQLVIGVGATFKKPLDLRRVRRRALRHAIVALGVVGFVARAALFSVVGTFLVRAALDRAPSEAHGPDRALDAIATLPHGHVLLVPIGLGLLAFGLFSFAAAPYARP